MKKKCSSFFSILSYYLKYTKKYYFFTTVQFRNIHNRLRTQSQSVKITRKNIWTNKFEKKHRHVNDDWNLSTRKIYKKKKRNEKLKYICKTTDQAKWIKLHATIIKENKSYSLHKARQSNHLGNNNITFLCTIIIQSCSGIANCQ